ncbi:MAG: tetratricopeptide repeat protein [Mariprofundales bacterium]
MRETPKPNNWQGVRQGLDASITLIKKRDLAEAEVLLREVLEFAPMEARAWHLLGKVYQLLGKHIDALDCFDRAGRMYTPVNNESKPTASSTVARLLWQQGNEDEARIMLQTLLAERPDDERLLRMFQEWGDV